MDSNFPSSSGRYLFSLLHGILVMVFIGWLPVVGPFVAGFASGTIIRDSAEGLKIALIIGIFGAIFISYLFNLFTLSILPKSQIGTILMNMLNYTTGLGSYILGLFVVLFAGLGGLIGGAITSRIEKEGYESGKAKGKDIGKLNKIRNEV